MMKLKKSRTANIKEVEVDFRVLQFSCLDQTMLSSLGKQAVQTRWLIEATRGEEPFEIVLTIDKSVMGSPDVRVSCKGEQVFPSGPKESGKLQNDFEWRWPFRGQLPGMLVPNAFHVRPEHSVRDEWFPATVMQQMEDGTFKVSAKFPSGQGGVKDIELPVVQAQNLREAATLGPIRMPMCALILYVPAKNPAHATLSVEKNGEAELLTHYFARCTPPPAPGKLLGKPAKEQRIRFEVSKDRKHVKCDSGYSELSHFLNGEVRTVARESPTKLKKFWKLQVGPFAEHTIELEKKSASSKIATLTVDGEVLCQASAEDIESGPEGWSCEFRLLGEKFLDWEVFTCNSDGAPLDVKTDVVHRTAYCHECVVVLKGAVPEATLTVDGRHYQDMADFRPATRSDIIEWNPDSLYASFGLVVPFKVDEKAPTGLARMASGKASGGPFAWLFGCCVSPDASVVSDIHQEIK